MLSKNQRKEIRLLHVSKYRKREQRFIAEGPTIVEEFISSEYTIDKIFATETWIQNNKSNSNTVVPISPKELQSISLSKTPNQVLATVKYPEKRKLKYQSPELILVLDTIQDPGNLGTIIRIADWFGIKKIVCSLETADAYNPKVVQASMGAITRIQIIYTDIQTWLKELPKNTSIYGALLNGENIYTTKLKNDGVIVIGNEGNGISKEIQQLITKRIKIPAYGDSLMESLNAAVATAIVCNEFRRL